MIGRGLVILSIGTGLALAALKAPAQQAPSAPARRFFHAGFEHDADALSFFRAFVTAVREDKREAVASMIRYPIKAATGSGNVTLKQKQDTIRNYDRVFTPCFKRILADIREEELWGNWRGAATPRGQLWFVPEMNGRVVVSAINGPFQGAAQCDLTREH